jgi:hypothetical protein
MQSKRGSLIEAIINVAVGYMVAVVTNMVVLPLFDIHVGLGDNMLIGLIFTAVSLGRSYLLRRIFNRYG